MEAEEAEDDPLLALASTVHTPHARTDCAGGELPHISGPPTPQIFLHHFLLPSRPAVFTRCVAHWPALHLWTHAYLREALGEQLVHVALTPDGLADAASLHARLPCGTQCFARPCEVTMPFSSLLAALESPSGGGRPVHYASHQDSSLEAEFGALCADVEPSVRWADEAYGSRPAAANLWMGEDAARTSVHADLFDNLYVVVRGTKRFTLLPPQEGSLLGRRPYRSASWILASEFPDGSDSECGFVLQPDTPAAYVPWTTLDLERDGASLQPIRATVRAGEMLYLPALWWHAVSQEADKGEGCDPSTIAVNYWYERPTVQL
ncbi:hypothetical protein AB1Y20_023479 [Prymnesium parvum]|uniref:JmjC domain-containing protein n=1 Tax=Prymnesium parvum TaxID=97485 RepID=A0AB34JGD1_PRYPA